MTSSLPRTLFIGAGDTPLTWYRCALPATVLGCDWVGAMGCPPEHGIKTGTLPGPGLDVSGYEVIVVELVHGPAWLQEVRRWQAQGASVLYEIDDWLRGIRRLEHHAFKDHFDRKRIEDHESVMRACDGVICSTPWLAERYAKVNPRTWVCRNGIDLRRYAYDRPERSSVTVGWAGGTGHAASAAPWMREVAKVMEERAHVRFVSVGAPFGHSFAERFGPERGMALPFMALEVYPAAMAHFDVAIAPAGRGGFFLGKSDLRWLEASALGIPTVADPVVYSEIRDGETGFHADSPARARERLFDLVDDAELRRRVGTAAHDYVAKHRSAQATARDWAEVLLEVAAERATGAAA